MLTNSSILIIDGTLVAPNFTYCSNNNSYWISIASLQVWIEQNRGHI